MSSPTPPEDKKDTSTLGAIKEKIHDATAPPEEKTTFENAKDATVKAFESAKEYVTEAFQNAGEAISNATTPAPAEEKTLGDHAQETYEKTKDATGKALDNAGEAIGKATTQAKEKIHEATAKKD